MSAIMTATKRQIVKQVADIRLTASQRVTLDRSLTRKVAAMTPADRVARRQQIIDAPASEAGDMEFAKLLFYPAE